MDPASLDRVRRWGIRARAVVGAMLMFLVLLGAGNVSCAADPGTSRKPNIVLVLIDTLRADHLGFMGYARATSPTLDKWAAESVVFDRAYSTAPWTPPSIASIFSGLYPTVHHVMEYDGKYGDEHDEKPQGDILAQDVETLAESLAAGGYQTAGFVSNPFLTRENGFAQGFDAYSMVVEKPRPYASATRVIEEAEQWIKSRKSDKPFFLYLHFMDVHEPFDAPDSAREPFVEEVRRSAVTTRMNPHQPKAAGWVSVNTQRQDPALKDRPAYWRALYDAGIAHLDSQLPRLSGMLHQAGLAEDTLVVITADHGEALNEQGGWNHGYSPFDHQYHVPLMMHWPRRWSAARRVSETTSLIGLKPTLLELAGAASSAFVQGRSFAALADGKPAATPGFAFCEGVKYDFALKAAYRGVNKVICNSRTGDAVYFDLARDPLESRRDRIPPDNAAVVELKKQLDNTVAQNDREAGRYPQKRNRPPTPSVRSQLATIGYVADDDIAARTVYGAFHFDPNAKKAPSSAPIRRIRPKPGASQGKPVAPPG